MTETIIKERSFYQFLIKAKQSTYAGEGLFTTPSRSGSLDLPFMEGEFRYLDSYLGGSHFIGEEVVWYQEKAVWGMNYYGRMLVDQSPHLFFSFLKSALLQVPEEMPFRGPEELISGDFCYTCQVEGDIKWYRGKEMVFYQSQKIYQLYFHGGEIKV